MKETKTTREKLTQNRKEHDQETIKKSTSNERTDNLMGKRINRLGWRTFKEENTSKNHSS